jgi:hypothetical protein
MERVEVVEDPWRVLPGGLGGSWVAVRLVRVSELAAGLGVAQAVAEVAVGRGPAGSCAVCWPPSVCAKPLGGGGS